LVELLQEVEQNEKRKKEQAAKGLDAVGYFVLRKLTEDGIKNAEAVSRKVAESFTKFPNWQRSEGELRELRKQVTFALLREEDEVEKVTERRRSCSSESTCRTSYLIGLSEVAFVLVPMRHSVCRRRASSRIRDS
jgi:hypothetical protein